MAELDLDAIKTRADAAHGCTSDPCGSPVCQTQRDRAALVAEVERLRVRVDEFEGLDDALIRLRTHLAEKDRELALLRVMKAPAATPAEVVYATHTDMSKPPYRKVQP